MVRVFQCHCFASKQVIPITVEPLTICASGDKVFVATSDCEILVFSVSNDTSTEIQRLPTISQVEKIIFNTCKNYIATVEQKKSWKKMTHFVRVYLNWEKGDHKNSKPRTKVRVAGKSHVQHVSSSSSQSLMEIIEIPVDKHATGIAVCSETGNLAVACGYEVKLCCVVEKTIANSDKTYLDVEVFLELCWNFLIQSIALCEEFVVCCSKTEAQGIRVRYDEGKESMGRLGRRSVSSPIACTTSGSMKGSIKIKGQDASEMSSYSASPKSSSFSDSDVFTVDLNIGGKDELDIKQRSRQKSIHSSFGESSSNKDLSTVGRRQIVSNHLRSGVNILTDKATLPVDDENCLEWNFKQPQSSENVTCLPGLHTDKSRSQCHHHFQTVSPPVLSDFSGGKVKSSSAVKAETVLYLNDISEKEEWMKIELIPSYAMGSGQHLNIAIGTDRMTSAKYSSRTSVCCFVGGQQTGHLYELSPELNQVSTYEYTDKAAHMCCGDQNLYVMTRNGMETYTSRWGAVAMESMSKGQWNKDNTDLVHPPSSLETCLCGHEPFLGVVDMCCGRNFICLLSKMEYTSSSVETVWSFYIVHSQSLLDQCKDMLQFAENVRTEGAESYLHLLQEVHLLLSVHMIQNNEENPEFVKCLIKVKRLLGDVYAQPDDEGWRLCHSYYSSAGISVDEVVSQTVKQVNEKNAINFGKGVIDYLDKLLFSDEMEASVLPQPSTAEDILNMYAIACPEQLSKLILLSNLAGYKPDSALIHLKAWLSVKINAGQPMSTTDKLAMVQLHLTQCEVEVACSELDSISKTALVEICCSHPKLLHKDLKSFTNLGQLMRWHNPTCMMQILVEMLEQGLITLDSLLILLQSQDQSDIHHNSHVKQVLELIVTDEKRNYIFEECVNILCEIYITLLRERKTSARQCNTKGHMKFASLQGSGHFAVRYGWLDQIPPFEGSIKMLRPCRNLEVKRVFGQGSRVGSKSMVITSGQEEKLECPCCLCNENLLKLQSMLCSSNVTHSLARHILDSLTNRGPDEIGQITYTFEPMDTFWDSIQLLCLSKIDIDTATEEMVQRYPLMVANFSSLSYQGDVSKYSFLLQCMEKRLKKFTTTKSTQGEQAHVKAYKDLLSRLAEMFPPTQFIQLLPKDGSLFFLLPFITQNLELESTNSLKHDIIFMGKEMLSQIA